MNGSDSGDVEVKKTEVNTQELLDTNKDTKSDIGDDIIKEKNKDDAINDIIDLDEESKIEEETRERSNKEEETKEESMEVCSANKLDEIERGKMNEGDSSYAEVIELESD